MNQKTKKVLIIINSFALVAALIWAYMKLDYEPVITSIGLITTLAGLLFSERKENKISIVEPLSIKNNPKIKNEITITNNIENQKETSITPKSSHSTKEDLEKRKNLTNVLFIDDDTKFKIITILNKVGWKTKIIKDVDNMDADPVLNSHILFVDIQGVGIKLGFKDQGLGLAHSLKKKYPDKKVIIYSTESTGDRFHEALRSVDSFLSKNAEPFEFQELIEQYSAEIKL
jgi:hypothetical protein